MKIASLFLYPVKSLAGIAVDAFELDEFGPVGDRRWMLVGADGGFLTQRRHPRLALVGTALEQGQVILEIPGAGRFPLRPGPETCTVTVWQDQVEALVAEPGPAQALSQFCGTPVRLVYMPDSTLRPARAPGLEGVHRVSFADGFPFLVVSRASLDDLNARLAQPVDCRRFRPNIVLEGGRPWQEDHWNRLTLGNVTLALVKPCSRCAVTTVDPDTGLRSDNGDPLRTLSQFRRTTDGVLFGVNAIHLNRGAIHVGTLAHANPTENS